MKKILSVLFVSLFLMGCAPKNAPSSCDCVNLLMLKPDLKTNVPMDNKTFDKWKKCRKYHTGYATAILKCEKLKSKKSQEEVIEEVPFRLLNEILIIKNDGKRHFEGKPFTGVAFDVYDNGELWNEYNYKDGKFNGFCKQWNRNGQLIMENNYKDGEFRFRQSYHDNGQMSSKKNFKNFRSDGLSQRWYDNGQLEMEEIWKGGEVVSFKHWDKNGKLSNHTNYIDAYSEPMD